jgi:hypothetical protein
LKLPPYVHAFIDRHGKARYYFRRLGFKQVPLAGLPLGPVFMAAYEAAMGCEASVRAEIGARRTKPGTVNALVVIYYKSDDWSRLTLDTQKTRRRIIERFRAQHGDKRVALLQREHIIKMMGAMDKPTAKRHWLKAIRGLMKSAVPRMRMAKLRGQGENTSVANLGSTSGNPRLKR